MKTQPTTVERTRIQQIYLKKNSFTLELNNLPRKSVLSLILWEALKAYLRGTIISFQVVRKKKKCVGLVDLED